MHVITVLESLWCDAEWCTAAVCVEAYVGFESISELRQVTSETSGLFLWTIGVQCSGQTFDPLSSNQPHDMTRRRSRGRR